MNGYVAHVEEMRNVYTIFVKNFNRRNILGDVDVDARVILKYILHNYGANLMFSVYGLMERFCEYPDEPSGSIGVQIFLNIPITINFLGVSWIIELVIHSHRI
jgi:hypothetical protein